MIKPTDPVYRGPRRKFEIDSNRPQKQAIQQKKIELHALARGHYPGTLLEPNQLEGISSIGFLNGAGEQDWGLEEHRNEGVEICYLETGSMAFLVGANNYALRAGHFTITRPWQVHKLGAPNIGPGKLHWLILDVGVRRPNQEWHWPKWLTLTLPDRVELTRKLRHNENPVWQASPEIAAACRGLSQDVLNWTQPHTESHMVNLLNQLLLGILVALNKQQMEEDPDLISRRRTVELFLRDLAGNPARSSESWTLPGIAEHCGMGITSFTKYCRELVNNGPIEYLNRCRLDHAARQLIASPATPVTEIAIGNGFSSSQYFATLFRRRFRTTPQEYRFRRAGDRNKPVIARAAR